MNIKIFFRPICWWTEFYYAVYYNIYCSGHEYVSEYSGQESAYHKLTCKICGHVSK